MASYHPQIVHFVIGLLCAGVAFRLVSLTRWLPFSGPAATTLILAGTVASFLAVQSGTDAHGPVEQIPGVRGAVIEHEEWGERTRNAFVVVSIVELAALLLAWRQHAWRRPAAMAAAVGGLVGLVPLYEAAEHGGELVYSYAGGVGIRSGNPEDVNRLFLAGAYQQALQDRQAGRAQEAMALIDTAATRFPANLELQLMAAEWTTEVKQDPAAALGRLDAVKVPPEDARLRIRAGIARADALAAQNNTDGARAVLQTLQAEFPTNQQLQRRLDQLSGVVPSP
jgi:uncharacterized membrane protein